MTQGKARSGAKKCIERNWEVQLEPPTAREVKGYRNYEQDKEVKTLRKQKLRWRHRAPESSWTACERQATRGGMEEALLPLHPTPLQLLLFLQLTDYSWAPSF